MIFIKCYYLSIQTRLHLGRDENRSILTLTDVHTSTDVDQKKIKINLNSERGLFTWPNQDGQMNMTEIGENDRKIDNNKH